MPRVKVDYVISFSSEDPDNPASNLLATDISKKKWLGAAKGETSNSVVLQLCKSTRICSVNIGAYDSALVEVLVGRSEKPLEPFKVLVLSSIFMSPGESKKGEGMSKVRTFNHEQLAADTRDQSWDRVRVVCLQPYNKHIKYGLSFIHIFEPELASKTTWSDPAPTMSSVPKLLKFDIGYQSSDEEDSFKPGELFAKIKQNTAAKTTDAQIRQASTPRGLKNTNSSAHVLKTSISKDKPKQTDLIDPDEIESLKRDRDELLYTADDQKPNDKIDRIMQKDRDEKEKQKEEERMKIVDKQRKNEDKKRKHDDSLRSDDNILRNTKLHKNEFSLFINEKPGSSNDRTKKNGEKNHENSKESSYNDTTPKNKCKDRGYSKDSDTIQKNKHRSDRENGRDSRKKDDKSSRYDSDKKRDRSERNGDSSRYLNKHGHSKDSIDVEQQHKQLKPGPRTSSPHRLMQGVLFVMSGYTNPRRAQIRDKALAMGAGCKQDWGDGCTHLICAFPKTPKLKQVRSSSSRAVVVTGEWIEDCCKERRLLPWQWYATEPDKRVTRTHRADSPELKAESEECDTDDEIQKVLEKQQDAKAVLPDVTQEAPDNSTDQIKDKDEPMDTSHESDVAFVADERIKANISLSDSEHELTDEESQVKEKEINVDKDACLPDFFDGYTFAIDTKLQDRGFDINLLKRYITAFSGEIVEHIHDESNVNYILSLNPNCDLKKMVESSIIVRPDWVWRCNDNKKKVSSKDFVIK